MDIRSKETYDLLKPVIESIDKTFIVNSITNLGGGKYKIFTDNTLWITNGYTLTIGVQTYTVEDLAANEWITVSGSVLPTATEFEVYAPFFWHGNILAQNQQMNLIPDSKNKMPMIWLHEKTREKFINDPLSLIDRESDVDLYFLIDNNVEDWLQLEEDNYTIKPMRNLINAFVDACNEWPDILDPFDYDTFDAPKFGSYQDNKGNTKQIFSDRVSGCEFKSTITFLKTLNDCKL